MIVYCFRGEISEVKQCFHFGILRHLEHWVLVSKKVKEWLKGHFFETCQWILFWKSGTTFCICTKPQGIFPSHKRESFSVLEKNRKIWRHLMTLQKLYFCWIFPSIHTLPNSTGSQLSRISRTISKLGKEMSDTCGYVNFSVEISELVFSANQGVKKSKKEQNFPFCYFLAFVHILILKENSY